MTENLPMVLEGLKVISMAEQFPGTLCDHAAGRHGSRGYPGGATRGRPCSNVADLLRGVEPIKKIGGPR